jgi:hypothetical protein
MPNLIGHPVFWHPHLTADRSFNGRRRTFPTSAGTGRSADTPGGYFQDWGVLWRSAMTGHTIECKLISRSKLAAQESNGGTYPAFLSDVIKVMQWPSSQHCEECRLIRIKF